MKLANYRLSNGEEAVGEIAGNRLFPLDLSAGNFGSLFDLLEAENPLDAADSLVDRRNAIGVDSATILAPNRTVDLPYQPSGRRTAGIRSADRYNRLHGYCYANTLLSVTARQFVANAEALQTEAFGNASLLVVADDVGQVCAAIPASLVRFSMLQCYDNVRPNRLPACLQDKNPGDTWRYIDGRWTRDDVTA